MSGESARQRYARRLNETAAVRASVAGRQRFMIALRTLLFFAAAGMLVLGYGGAEPRWLLLIFGWISAAGFLVAITVHEHFRLADLEAERSMQFYSRLVARTQRDWSSIPPSTFGKDVHSALADDLDLFGTASLWQLIHLGGTAVGRKILCDWLLTAPTWQTVTLRQEAVRELRDAPLQREKLVELISTISSDASEGSELANWASGALWLPKHKFAHALSWGGPLLLVVGALVFWLGLPADARSGNETHIVAWTGLILIATAFLVNLLTTIVWGSWLHDIFVRVTGQYRQSSRLRETFESLGALPGQSEMLRSIRRRVAEDPMSAVPGLKSLSPWIWCANLQRDPIFYVVYLFLQLTIAWDFRVMERLEVWQRRFGAATNSWFEAMGECEALIAGATLAEEYPEWCFPQPVRDLSVRYSAVSIGHPLLKDSQRVVNTVQLAQSQPLLLVTGSNMAGKSTLLRAWGLNELLVRIGAPVCAIEYQSPIFELATSIRVRDSLQEGVSFFMAELKRLKEVVDIAALAHQGPNSSSHREAGHPVLFLLDEILQGTNSRERQIAVVQVVESLVELGACGAISTHDLELADQPVLTRMSQVVHFREYFETVDGQERMRFDYVMRPGPTPTTNALKLLSLVGLGRTQSNNG